MAAIVYHGYQGGGTNLADAVYIKALAARPDGSVVLGGSTDGGWYGELSPEATRDFMAVALDEDGAELWRWQVILIT